MQFRAILLCMNQAQDKYFELSNTQLICKGAWTLANVSALQSAFTKLSFDKPAQFTINGKALTNFDSAGAWLICKLQQRLQNNKVQVSLEEFDSEHQKLLSIIEPQVAEDAISHINQSDMHVTTIGKTSIEMFHKFQLYLAFVGQLSIELLWLFKHPRRFRIPSYFSVVLRTGLQALPIIALLSFMIGVVMTYQMGLQLRSYGANIYIVDLLGLSILREFAPLLTAIMVAGRTGSAYTAQLGMMKINQEIDALYTMGVTPGEMLLLPRIVGLVISLPLLTMWADIFGILGGMVMANSMLNISWYDFLTRFPHVIPLKTLLIGLMKAPVFALVISSIGCYEGMNVKENADSVGENTTRSVVLSIFFIILVDAVFSIVLSKLKI